MSETPINPVSLIPEARRFERQMDRVIQRGRADTWRGAEDELIAADITPQVSPSRRREYEERQEALKQVTNLTTVALHHTFVPSTPETDTEKRIKQPGLIVEINKSLDQGVPISIAGFQRQGKTSLAFAIGESRQGLFVHADAQSASLAAGHFPTFMTPAAYSKHGRIQSVISNYQNPETTHALWSALNDYAELGGERILICFDEIGMLANENLAEYRALLAEEMAEIAELGNLDLLIIEHISDSDFVGEQLDILPLNTKRFIAAPVSGPDIFDFLRMHTREQRVTFTPEAATEIYALTGGRLALAALVGESVINFANEQDRPHFIYTADDLKDWEAAYEPRLKHRGQGRTYDDLFNVMDNVFRSLSSVQQVLVETIAQSDPGLSYRGTPSDDVDFLIQAGLVTHNLQYGRLEITSRLLKNLVPGIRTWQC